MLLDAFGSRWPTGLTHGKVRRHVRWVRAWILAGRLVGTPGWDNRESEIVPLVSEAQREFARVVTERIYPAVSGKAEILTIGIDLCDDAGLEHVELVAAYCYRSSSLRRRG